MSCSVRSVVSVAAPSTAVVAAVRLADVVPGTPLEVSVVIGPHVRVHGSDYAVTSAAHSSEGLRAFGRRMLCRRRRRYIPAGAERLLLSTTVGPMMVSGEAYTGRTAVPS